MRPPKTLCILLILAGLNQPATPQTIFSDTPTNQPTINTPTVNIPHINVPQPNTVQPTLPNQLPSTSPTNSRPKFFTLPTIGQELTTHPLAHRPSVLPPVTVQSQFSPTNPAPVRSLIPPPKAPTPKVPAIFEPILFNTPAADELLADLQVFPPDNPWNQVITNWPARPNSDRIIDSIGNMRLRYNLDMGFILVPPYQGKANVRIDPYQQESDPGPYPLPDNIPIEGWPVGYKGQTLDDVQRNKLEVEGDRHAIVVDPTAKKLYEFYIMRKTPTGWQAAQASIFDLTTNKLRPNGWTSADAAGLPIFPAVVRYDELKRGVIRHALRVTVRKTRRAYVAPATHYASKLNDEDLPRMGERLRLRSTFDVANFSRETQVILNALKQYGMFVADNGGIFAISVAPDERMPATLGELGRLKSSDFEVVEAPKKP